MGVNNLEVSLPLVVSVWEVWLDPSFLFQHSDVIDLQVFCDDSLIELGSRYASRTIMFYFYNIWT